MKIRILALLLALCMVLSVFPAVSAEDSIVTVTVPGVEQYTKESTMTRELNNARQEKGLPALVRCYNLTQLARQRAAEIALYCDHIRPDGSDWSTVWTDNGSNCTALAENIVMGISEPYAAINFWMNDEEAAANLLSTEYTEVGIACLQVGDIYCWVQIFGTGSDQGGKSYSKTGKDDSTTDVAVLTSNLIPVKQDHYIEMPNGLATRLDVTAYKNLPAGEGWHLNLIPECQDIVTEGGAVIAKTNVYPGGTGKLNFATRRPGIGVGSFPVYEGQPDPITLTVNCGSFEKPDAPVRPAPTASASPYAHVHTPELMNAVEGTCTTEGYTGDLTCTACLEVLDEGGHYLTDHTWGPWVVTDYPKSAMDAGSKEHTCTVCGTTETTSVTLAEDPHPDGNTISVSANISCKLSQSITAAREGHPVFVTIFHKEHFYVKNVTVTTASGDTIDDRTCIRMHSNEDLLYFTMPDEPVQVYVELEEMPKHSIILDVGEGGTASVTKESDYEGGGFYLSVTPDAGYMISSITLLSHGTYIPYSALDSQNRWYVEIPDGDLEILVRFIPSENPFADVKESDYFFTSVLWAYHNGVTTGIDQTHFVPGAACSRAQIVTFLWRTAGSPSPVTTENPFEDVDPTNYFYNAVLWAAENGITTGTDATHFSPSKSCTRAEAVTFLWRACGQPEALDGNHPFVDVEPPIFYYQPMLWALNHGITSGTDATHFSPNNVCNRAQIVTFLYRTFLF